MSTATQFKTFEQRPPKKSQTLHVQGNVFFR